MTFLIIGYNFYTVVYYLYTTTAAIFQYTTRGRMLNTETKRRIDTARDILVGKVPDPKSQVEQITIALIYKFMDDMDTEVAELGGERTFFNGEFEQYAWSKLLSPALGGHDVLSLYSDAIQKMNQNPNIPQLFRDIFKNAFLPYRDPETLKSFLKIINEFSYDHSEKLGDAFEYLLSVLGSQGDAGQFRTPRHIIDFIVDVVNPQKHERILDVACGTAGFLISAYKHIVKHNSSNFDPGANTGAFEKTDVPMQDLTLNGTRYKGDLLTPDDRSRLAENIHGYDISPDMVRLSLVNMYLHSISNPKIDEYDTLTSDERWNEYFDVILANPPFMSPKGGIRPHNRFSVTSKRSEVLFVDYIAEHLTPLGRAGVIVPEGIIFQSQNAYKQLREMLVKNYLIAVVSLPAGVFNPYSGVKTSILLLDKQLNKKTKNILFVKINNDGFDLGAQRRPMPKNDLPEAARLLKTYVETLRTGEEFFVENFSLSPLLVEKERLAESGEFNLSGERYRESSIGKNTKYQLIPIGDMAEVIAGQSPKGEFYNDKKEGIPFYQGKTEFGKIYVGEPRKWTTQITRVAERNDILMSVRAPVGPVNISTDEICIGRGLAAIRVNEKLDYKYLFYNLRQLEKEIKGGGGSVFDSISKKQIEKIEIPLPPLDIQREIVAEIEGYQKIIDGARQVVEHYKPQITINPEWEMVELGHVCEVISGYSFDSKDFKKEGEVKSIKITNVGVQEFVETNDDFLSKSLSEKFGKYVINEKDIVVALTRSVISTGFKVAKVPKSYDGALLNQRVAALKEKKEIALIDFIYIYLTTTSVTDYVLQKSRSLMQPNLSIKELAKLEIPLPDLATQERLVAQIEREQALVNANKELIKLYEGKIKERIARVWGEK